MKKLLTLLFTFVLVITIGCINTNTVKAEPNAPVDYSLWLHADGSLTKEDDTTTVPYPTGLTYEEGVWKMNNFDFSTTAENGIIVSEDITLEIKGENSITVTNSGTSLDGAIYINNGSYTGKLLTIKSADGSNTPTLTLSNTVGNNSSGINFDGNNIKIISGTVNCTADNSSLRCNKLEVENAVVNLTSTNATSLLIQGNNALVINGIGIIKSKTEHSYSLAVSINSQDVNYLNNNFYVKGSTTGATTPLSVATFIEAYPGMGYGIYCPAISGTKAKYAEITSANVANYGLEFNTDGTLTKSTDHSEIATWPTGLSYSNGVWTMDNFEFKTTAQYGIVLKGATTIEINNTNTIKVNFPNNDDSSFVFYIDDGTYTDKNITIKKENGANNPVLNIENITSSESSNHGIAIQGNNLIIDNVSVNVKSDDNATITGSLTIKNGTLYTEVLGSTSDVGISVTNENSLYIDETSVLKVFGDQILVGSEDYYSNSNFNVKGTTDGSKINLSNGQLKKVFGVGPFAAHIGDTRAIYAEIKCGKAPSPTPSPSKKDESCEKVIGPTWHWNNDKGICEDIGVVSTSTR